MLKCSKGACADLESDFFAVDDKCFLLKVWLPNFLGVTLRKADIAAELLAFTGNFTFFHGLYISVI